MWRLKSDGSLAQNESNMSDDAQVIDFGSYHDGRGFSEAAMLRRAVPDAFIIATGPLIPDQARMAFQSGIDEIWLDESQFRHGIESWQQALSSTVTSLYTSRGVSRLDTSPIWHH